MSDLGEYAEPVEHECQKCGVSLAGIPKTVDYCGPCGEYLRFKTDHE
jgi:hypothetical protein